ncbi:MFS transporter [Sphingomonas sp. AR_OL41]|uniref:MFS transporter n=1 Tax=Sphingomonas sp. AR_OL41 TaxID=3042729 RepID=UPI002480CF1F|nr:MFS transporter [Sphingomonas sp. AR_OL41]MDH7973672.1 MFS transporter [Sphingomonas sp. AR_OL41]
MIGRRERWSYAAGDVGFNFVWQSVELYLLFYYIRGLGISPQVASAIFLVGAAVDWMIDPLVGTLVDRAAPRIPLRLWVLAGGPLSVLLLAFAFVPLPVAPALVPAFALATYLALRAAYGVGNIPYGALTARISSAPQDHLALTSARMQGAAIGGLVAALIYALLPTTGSAVDFRLGALLLAALALPAFLATFWGVSERVTAPPQPASETLGGPWQTARATLGLLRRSAALRRLLATVLAAGLAITVINKSLLFLFEEIGALRLGYFVALAPAASLLLTTPIWAALGARLGRSQTLLLASLLNVMATAAALLTSGAPALILTTCIAIVAGCGMSVMFWSLVPAAVADCERQIASTGCAGRIYALANIARKLAQALAPTVVALTLVGTARSTLEGMMACAIAALAVILIYRPREAIDDGVVPPLNVAYAYDAVGKPK